VEWLMAARFLQALGAAAGLVAPRAIVADLCDTQEAARIFSLLMQVMMIAPILAPLIGGYLLSHGNWRFIFWVLTLLGIIGLFWSLRTIHDSLPKHQRAPLHLGSILRAYYTQLKAPVFMAYTIAGGLALGSLFTYISTAAFIFTSHYQLNPTQFSYLFAGNSIALVTGGQISNMLLKRLPMHTILYIGLILHSVAAALLFFIADTATLPVYIACLALSIGALGLVFGNITALTMEKAGPQAGVASALMGTLHYLVAAVIGYAVSLAAQEPATLPLAITCCGIGGIACCMLARHKESKQATLA
jgi:DHA1 family bicyclomycin/chloramphenicol resistance-like MFS transporter